MLSCSFTFVRIVAIYTIFGSGIATATKVRLRDDDFVLFKRDVEYCRLYPWINTKLEGPLPAQCRSPITIDRQSAEVDNETTVTFVNYYKSIPDNVKVIRTHQKEGEQCMGNVTAAIFTDRTQNLHAIIKTQGQADVIYNLHFINVHFNCAEHKFKGRLNEPIILEAQFVHYDSRYNSLEAAAEEHLGLYIYSITFEKALFSEISTYSRATRFYFEILSRPSYKGPMLMSWRDILPVDSPSYVFLYVGSTVNPPCRPTVLWNVASPVDTGDHAKLLEETIENHDSNDLAEQTSDEFDTPSLAEISRLEGLLECAAECDLPKCRGPISAKNTQVKRIRWTVGPGHATKIGKIIAAILILIVLIVSICITVILRLILVALCLFVVAIIVLAVFGIIW